MNKQFKFSKDNFKEALDEAKQKYHNITLDEINAYKFSHGHIGSVY